MEWDYFIVGQGLAGSILSYNLIRNDLKVLVFDDPALPKSSTVAAGIYNPFTGRKMVMTWMAEQLFPYLLKFYKDMEAELGIRLLYNIPMYRPFLSLEEHNEWSIRLYEDSYSQFIERILSPQEALIQVVNPMGGMMLKMSGYVDIGALIRGVTDFLEQRKAFCSERFSYHKLQILKDHVQYNGHSARKIIFCEGPSMSGNNFFSWLPLNLVKGEILELELQEPLTYIVNRGVFVLPITKSYCRVGSTFDNQDLSWEVTGRAKTQLLHKLDKLIRIPYRVIGHSAGVRPASLDRRPFIGLHPEHEPLGVFNGLGTKGVSLSPYFAQEFFEFLEQGKPLIKHVAISRYFSLYYNKF
ncbi:MAG: FAD-binding oxidoreductase [Bacteroidetes bacterium]|nr:MAG: FAD-binding oxidoreductase [Bacteroidota bacterium]